jgi:patatin-like phospholipase/acyl hydrolase
VGGIIALGLACGINAKTIAQHIEANAFDIFGSPARLNPHGLFATRHRPEGLRCVVAGILGPAKNAMIRDLDRDIVVMSVDARCNRIAYFSNREWIGSTKCENASLLDVAMATSAAPTYFPAHEIGDTLFLDGGTASNNPDIECLRFCSAVLSRPIRSVRILSVGTGSVPYATEKVMDGGGLKWLTKYKLIERLMSLQESKAQELAADILGELYLRLDTTFDDDVPLDDIRTETLNMLRARASVVVEDQWTSDPRKVAEFLR